MGVERSYGQVILCRVYGRWSIGGGPRRVTPLSALVSANTVACILLIGAAIVHGEYKYLPIVLLGFVACSASTGYAARVARAERKRRLDSTVRNQIDCGFVANLVDLTHAGAFGDFLAGEGTMAWLTPAGIYDANGVLLPWGRFSAFGTDMPERLTHRIALRMVVDPLPPYARRILLNSILLLAAATGLVAYLAVFGLEHQGLRLDVLAALASAALPLPMLAVQIGIVTGLHRVQLGDYDLVVVANEAAVSIDDLVTLLQGHLPQHR